MNIRLHHIAIGIGIISLMTFLFLKTTVIDSDAHNHFNSKLRHLKEMDATLDKHVLESRYSLLTSYDLLISESAQINQLQATLKNIPEFVDAKDQKKIQTLLDEQVSLQGQKELLIERFKSQNAIINNSLRYFPVTTSKLITNISADKSRQNELTALNNLLKDTLIYYLSSDSELESEIGNQIAVLRDFQQKESNPEDKIALSICISHANTILRLKPEVDRLVKEIVSLQTADQIENIIELYDSSYYQTLGDANIYRSFLYIFSILLVGYIGYIIIKLKQATSALNSINENLEHRVQERTEALLWSNSELQKSETNNRALLNAIPDSMWRTNREGVLLDFISAKEERIVAPAREWVGKTVFDLLPPYVADQTMNFANRSLETGDTQVFEYQLVKGDKISHYEGRAVVCGESEILTIVRDITELKQAESVSQVSSEIIEGINTTSNLEELLKLVHYSISKLLYAENCFVALYDTKNELLNMQFFIDKFDHAPLGIKLGKGLSSYVFMKGIPMLANLETIHNLVESGDVEMIGTLPAVWLGVPLRTPNETIGVLVIQHYEDENAYNQRDLEFLTGVGDQIALAIERKRAEEALRASEARFQSAFDYAPIGIGLSSPEGHWLQVNHFFCEIVGYTKEELLQTDFQNITHPNDVADGIKYRDQLISGEIKSHQIEKRYIHKLGHQVLALASISLVRDAHNNPLYFISQVQDITEQKALQEQLLRGQKLESIGQLAAGIAHEINTPTQYVGDNTRFLKDGFQDFFTVLEKNRELLEACQNNTVTPELVAEMEEVIDLSDIEYLSDEIPRAIEHALHGVERISKIVQSMRDFAHPGSFDKKATDLNRAIESTITVASNEWKYVAEMVTNYDEKLPPVACLTGEFNQVILNMIVNASHAISDVIGDGSNGKGKITISTRRNGDWAEIRISDTGTGMPEEVCRKVFDPFFTTKEVGRGTGQGLAISHSVIVEKHKGLIRVESEVGKGTAFIISLPINEVSE